jgi:indolepyruvate ferredoxin oxidoreductase beta subunit
MEKNIILAGVGGQGILSIAFVIDNAALDAGFEFKQAEVHGMAQRGGAVQSNLRYADHEIHSDLIPKGAADMVLSVEPLEVMRYWHFLRPDGWVVSSVTPYINIPDYPETDLVLDQLATFPNCILVDGGLIAKAAGNLRAQNMVAVGAASSRLDFTEDQLLKYVEALFKPKGEKIVEVNQRAFRYGRAAGLFFRGLVDAGMAIPSALRLSQKIAPETYDPALAADWFASVGRDERRLESVLAADETITCDRIPAKA